MSASDGSLTASQTFHWFIVGSDLAINNPGDQTNSEGDTVSLPITAAFPGGAGSFVGSGLPTGLSISSSGVVSGTIAYSAAEDAAGGVYNVIVVGEDSYGDSSSIGFAWNVNDVIRPPTLTNPGTQTAAEGGAASLQMQASSPDGEGLAYFASGLPAGLSIDPSSGLISGTVPYGEAGSYTTTVTVQDDAGNTVSGQFQWTVTAVNTAPWLGLPMPAVDVVGDSVSLQLHGGDVDGNPVTFSVSGLPTGLSLNTTTGLISGVLMQAGSYDVTATDSDGSLTATQTFTWDVSASGPEVTIAINGTLDHADDVGSVGGRAPIPVVVTLLHATPGEHNVTLELPGESSVLSSLDRTFVQLADGSSATLWLTALQASAAEDDVQLLAFVDGNTAIAGDGKLTNEQVTFEDKIQNADTPKGMNPRIPRSVITPTKVTLNVTLTNGQAISLTIAGNDLDTAGMAGFMTADGAHFYLHLTQAGANDIPLYGGAQTKPTADGKGGNAGKLTLYAFVPVNGHDPGNGVSSNGFSVAAIPIGATAKYNKGFQGAVVDQDNTSWTFGWGGEYAVTMKSDSGDPQDLTETQVKEVIVPGKAIGAMIPFAGGLRTAGPAHTLGRRGKMGVAPSPPFHRPTPRDFPLDLTRRTRWPPPRPAWERLPSNSTCSPIHAATSIGCIRSAASS